MAISEAAAFAHPAVAARIATLEAALVAAVGRLGRRLVPHADAIAAEVRAAAVVGSDETSMRMDGQTW
jgi:hypothetical protein